MGYCEANSILLPSFMCVVVIGEARGEAGWVCNTATSKCRSRAGPPVQVHQSAKSVYADVWSPLKCSLDSSNVGTSHLEDCSCSCPTNEVLLVLQNG